MDIISWIFIIVFGAAIVSVISAFVTKTRYEKRMVKLFRKACEFSPEEQLRYQNMLKNYNIENVDNLLHIIYDMTD